MGVTDEYLRQERLYQQQELARRSGIFRRVLLLTSFSTRPVIVTDDGVATGATAQAAL